MHMAGVLYQALWEPVFTPSSGEHFSTVLRCWSSLLAWREVVILFSYIGFPSRAGNCLISHLCYLVLKLLHREVYRMLKCCTAMCHPSGVLNKVYFNGNFTKNKEDRER